MGMGVYMALYGMWWALYLSQVTVFPLAISPLAHIQYHPSDIVLKAGGGANSGKYGVPKSPFHIGNENKKNLHHPVVLLFYSWKCLKAIVEKSS